MRKPTFYICENKGEISFAVTGKLISAFVFAAQTVQFFYFLNPKFPASIHLQCLYISVYVKPVRKPHCWFFMTRLKYISIQNPHCHLQRTHPVTHITATHWLSWTAHLQHHRSLYRYGRTYMYRRVKMQFNPLYDEWTCPSLSTGESTFIFRVIRSDFKFLFHFPETPLSKQNSPRWNAVFCGVTSRAIPFANVP